MHSDGLEYFCRTVRIFTVIERVPGVEITRNEDRCSAVSVVNISNSEPSEHMERHFKVRLKWVWKICCQKVKLMELGWSVGQCRLNYCMC